MTSSQSPCSSATRICPKQRHSRKWSAQLKSAPPDCGVVVVLRNADVMTTRRLLREGAADPSAELREAYHFLARLRCYLHIQSGRDNNLLTFDAQDSLADHWRLPGAAQWMREYYRHSRAIYRAGLARPLRGAASAFTGCWPAAGARK